MEINKHHSLATIRQALARNLQSSTPNLLL
jgi:hypothetical protein